jgi:hypothetical protein
LDLLEEFDDARAAIEDGLRAGVEVAAELREGREFAELRQSPLILPATCLIALICAAEPRG